MGEAQGGKGVLHPLFALQAAVVSQPNVSMHLVTPLYTGTRRDVLLSMTAIKVGRAYCTRACLRVLARARACSCVLPRTTTTHRVKSQCDRSLARSLAQSLKSPNRQNSHHSSR